MAEKKEENKESQFLSVVCSRSEGKKHNIRFYADKSEEGKTPAFESIYISRLALLEAGVKSIPKVIAVLINIAAE